MSQYPPSSTANNAFTAQPPPAHHIHRDSEPLPGSRGAAPAAPNYDAAVTNDSRTWQSRNEREFGAGTDTGAVVAGGQHQGGPDAFGSNPTDSRTAYDEPRPLGVEPTGRGGVAVGGDSTLPECKANVTDKIIGKTQKVAGKVTHNAAMHEKGELREAGGKLAAQGEARAPHD